MSELKRLTIMVRVDDTARADIALTPERTYYRLATDTSIEDGELAPVADFYNIASEIIEAFRNGASAEPLPKEVKLQVFANNRLLPETPSETSLRDIISLLTPLYPEFTFLEGFK